MHMYGRRKHCVPKEALVEDRVVFVCCAEQDGLGPNAVRKNNDTIIRNDNVDIV